MANIDSHPPGTFAWIELGTTDSAAAKQFYGSLFGWSFQDADMGPGGVYTTFTLEGRSAAACYALSPDMKAQGIPPHWMLYVCTADADATAAKVVPAGGKVMNGPFDVMTYGRMAVLQDPAGAVFSIWQPKTHQGIQINSVPGTLCWADLSTPDQAGAAAFYKAVFGWEGDFGKEKNGYWHIKNGSQYVGGIIPSEHHNANVPPHWLAYFFVQDCDASTAKATAGGATVYFGPETMEGVGRWAVVADPQGATFALFQPMPRNG